MPQPVQATPIRDKDVKFLMGCVGCSSKRAYEALVLANGDMGDAIMSFKS